LETYAGQLEGFPNLHLIKQGTVEGWILRASAIIHRGSSTAIEASLAGLPAFSPSWIPAPVSYPAVDAVSVPCSSEEELCAALRQVADGKFALPEQLRTTLDQVLGQWFSVIDGYAHRRVADVVMESLAGPQVSLEGCRKGMENIDGPEATWLGRSRARGRKLLGLSPHWSFRQWREVTDLSWDRSERYFGAAEVEAIVQGLEPAAARISGKALRGVRIDTAQAAGDYHFGYRHGRSIRIAPA
jgi:hypothetical protein